MKFILLVADGMGDWPLEELSGKTPLAAAATPAMDDLAAAGVVGTCRTVPAGMPPGSDVANMSLLGFDPREHHTGRGPIEAAAQGLELADDDLVWRLNLVTATELSDAGIMRDYSAGHISTQESAPLIRDLAAFWAAETAAGRGDASFQFYPGVQYRHLLVQKGAAKSADARLSIQPPHDITDKPMRASIEAYASCPGLWRLVEACTARLKANPANATKANAIWPWGQGRALKLPSFAEVFGLSGAVISAVDLIKGLGRAASMEVLDVPGATGLVDTNYQGKLDAALDYLSRGDFVLLHLEGPDECGHGGDTACKVTALERIDRLVLGPLRQAMADRGDDAAFLVTCDHLTPIALRTHHADPVPFLLWWPGCQSPSRVSAFTEASAASGLLVEPGHTLLNWALERIRG